MDKKENQDALDSILDSITMDDTMERKIHEFSQNKKRSQRIQKARDASAKFQETYASGKPNEEIVLDHEDYSQASIRQNESTQAFDPRSLQKVNGASQSVSQTSNFTSQPANNQVTQTIVPGQIRAGQLGSSYTEDAISSTHVYPGNRQERYGDSLDKTRVSQPVYPGQSANSFDASRVHADVRAGAAKPASQPVRESMVYDSAEAGNTHTKVMSGEELQNYYQDLENPVLKREYVGDDYERPQSRHHFNWRIPLTVAALVVAGVLCVGAYQFVTSWIDSYSHSQLEDSKTESYFEQLLDWANDYNSLSDKDKKKILSLERLYNRLNESQRDEINKILSSITGKTFDELLADASAGDKSDSNNNNTEIAEKKAEIKSKIAALKQELEDLKNSSPYSQADLDSAFAVLTDRQSAEEKAAKELDSASSKLDQANKKLEPYNQTAADLQAKLKAAQDELDALLAEPSDPGFDENGNEVRPPENPSIQNARQKVADITAEISRNEQNKVQAQSEVDLASNDYNNAKVLYDNAASELMQAQANYDTIKNGMPDRSYIDSINQQINDLQSEYDSL